MEVHITPYRSSEFYPRSSGPGSSSPHTCRTDPAALTAQNHAARCGLTDSNEVQEVSLPRIPSAFRVKDLSNDTTRSLGPLVYVNLELLERVAEVAALDGDGAACIYNANGSDPLATRLPAAARRPTGNAASTTAATTAQRMRNVHRTTMARILTPQGRLIHHHVVSMCINHRYGLVNCPSVRLATLSHTHPHLIAEHAGWRNSGGPPPRVPNAAHPSLRPRCALGHKALPVHAGGRKFRRGSEAGNSRVNSVSARKAPRLRRGDPHDAVVGLCPVFSVTRNQPFLNHA